ncbi:MAG: glutamine--fructose-6-phosphate transaminase (isomerizing) [Pseudomonadota bacterium]|nr:glutamine--fructose-6-phosphate transaminase (isomerizing) [Pseudomonadota bacterium]MEE3295066.1 glutamine--fructose-6-phosphate transaminase (isomerizing) [Pseudomonadota bacterium]
MCGIIGIIGNDNVTDKLFKGLRKLEYRGYDSSGIATINNSVINCIKSEGNLNQLEKKLINENLPGNIGIGHTRWATHGVANEVNAHPHVTDEVAIVHNGIIENYSLLKNQITANGIDFVSDTDTEAIAHLLTIYLNSGMDTYSAIRATTQDIKGTYALVVLIKSEPDKLYAVRKGSPLAIGFTKEEMFVGSDAYSLGNLSNEVIYLQDNDVAILERNSYQIFDVSDQQIHRKSQKLEKNLSLSDKGAFKHFMAKEIHEQPDVIFDSINHYIDKDELAVNLPKLPFNISNLKNITLVACGSSYYSGLVAREWFERFTRIKVDVEIASEFRYREAPMDSSGLTIFISQSGETADTLAALKHCKKLNQKTVSIVNVPNSSMSRNSDASLKIFAGPEIGVASTKAFTCQLLVLACLAINIGRENGIISNSDENEYVKSILNLPRLISNVLNKEDDIIDLVNNFHPFSSALYLGRGQMFPIAMEGALKLKEISYIHAEGYPAGEMKHGPIALLEKGLPVMMGAPYFNLFDKTISNLHEVIARYGKVLLVTDQKGLEALGDVAKQTKNFIVDEVDIISAPFVYILPYQLFAYHTALLKGTDVDQPRNLAKSVTVE